MADDGSQQSNEWSLMSLRGQVLHYDIFVIKRVKSASTKLSSSECY